MKLYLFEYVVITQWSTYIFLVVAPSRNQAELILTAYNHNYRDLVPAFKIQVGIKEKVGIRRIEEIENSDYEG